MSTLSAHLPSNFDEVPCLNTSCLSKDSRNSFLNCRVLIVQMYHDLFNGVLVEATAPWILKLFEKYLEYCACFDSNAILSIIKAFKKFDIEVSDVILAERVLYVFKYMSHKHN